MGKQVRFYATHEDEVSFLDHLRDEAGCVVLLPNFTDEHRLAVIDRIDRVVPGYSPHDPVLLVSDAMLSELTIDEYGPQYFRVNEHKSPVAVWSRAFSSSNGSLPGGLWYEERQPKKKVTRDFLDWMKLVTACLRRLFDRRHDFAPTCLMGADFFSKLETGGVRLSAA